MAKNDDEIILEAYNQVNEGILARARAGLNDSLIGRAVNSVGNILTGNTQGLTNNLAQDSAHMRFDSLLKSHQGKITKVIQNFINDLVKSNVINQQQGATAQGEIITNLINNLQQTIGANKGTGLSNTVNAVASAPGKLINGVKNVWNGVKNAGQQTQNQ